MTADVTPPPSPAPRHGSRRPRRSTLVVAGGAVAALLVALLLGSRTATTTADHDPDNPGPTGARAVAEVLRDEGVRLDVVRSAEQLESVPVGPRTTVLVTSSDHLGSSTARRLLDHAGAGTVVVAAPGPGTTEALGVDRLPSPATASSGEVAGAGCPALAGPVDLDGLRVRVDRGLAWPTARGCFRVEDGWLVALPRDGLVLLGAAGVLENDQVLRADNAALALRLLGSGDRLVWYVPDLADLPADDGVSLRSLLPPWLVPALWLVALAAVATLLWRGRRLGPLSVEPLPVAVRAIETTRGRGRLYRRSGDRAHAATVLRHAARADVRRHLRLPHADTAAVVRAAARHTGRPEAEIHRLLADDAPPPRDDHELTRLARDLARIQREAGTR